MSAIGNPVFTQWTDLVNNNDLMSFTYTGTNSGTGEALIYVETTLWDQWTTYENPTVDEVVELQYATGNYNGYARAFRITTELVADYPAGDKIGACFYRMDKYISCVAWESDGAGTYTPTSYRAYHYDQSDHDPLGRDVTTYSAIGAREFEGIDEKWLTSHDGFTSFSGWLYQTRETESGAMRFTGTCNNCSIYVVENETAVGTLQAVTMLTDWMSAISGLTMASIALLSTSLLAF